MLAARLFPQETSADLLFISTTSLVKMEYRSVRRRSGIPKLIIIFPLKMARAQAEAI